MSVKVTIAVVSYNTRELLRRCLESMRAEAEAGRAEVWVVDNASNDGSAGMVRADFPWARLIASDQNLGFGSAINEVAARANAPWIAPANADVELTPGAVDALLAAASDSSIGVLAPRLVMPDGGTQHSVHAFPTIRLALLFAIGAYRLPGVGERLCVEGYWDPDRPRRVDWAHGAFLLVRREAFERIGGFDPAQWMYAEDIDLQWRAARAGFATAYVPQARVRHAVSAATTSAFGSTRTARHLAATYEWLDRRRGRPVERAVALLNLLGAMVRWIPAWALSAAGVSRFAPMARRFGGYARAHARGLRSREALRRAVARPG